MKRVTHALARIVNGPLYGVALALCGAFFCAPSSAQAPAAEVTPAPPPMSAADLDKLVGPIALYPDDLVAIILPSATYPVEIVQAERFLEQRKNNPSLPVNESLHDPVKALLNYPEVVKKMSTDLDWTISLGEAVVADQGAVLEAIQRFRRQTQSAGHLKSDDKQQVVVEKEVIKIVPADPQVIYVPQYDPATVVVASAPVTYAYAPTPYPVYYYPYAPGAAFATGLIWGAAMSAIWHGGHYATHYGGGGNNTININRENNFERNTERNTDRDRNNANGGDRSRGDRNQVNGGNRGSSAWKPDKKPGQVSGISDRAARSPRVGDPPSRGNAGAGNAGRGQGASRNPSASTRDMGSRNPSASTRDMSGRNPSASTRDMSGRGASTSRNNAFSGYGSARDATANSARGASSRQSMSNSRNTSRGGGGFSGGGSRGGGGGGGRPRGGGRR